MARFKFFLLEPNGKKETPIFLSITYSGKRVKLKTKQKVNPKAWNSSSKSIKANWTEYADVQAELNRIELIAKKGVAELKKKHQSLPPEKELKKILEAKFFNEEGEVKTSFWEYFEAFIEKLSHKKNPRTGKPISRSTIESYHQTFKTLEKFEKKTGDTLSYNMDIIILMSYLFQIRKK